MSENIYADAINKELGVVAAPIPAATKPAHRKPEPFPNRPPITPRANPVVAPKSNTGDQATGLYGGVSFVVRELGVTTFSPAPGEYGFWFIRFYTDDELRIENARGNLTERAAIARRAIDRYLADAPVYAGPYQNRNLSP